MLSPAARVAPSPSMTMLAHRPVSYPSSARVFRPRCNNYPRSPGFPSRTRAPRSPGLPFLTAAAPPGLPQTPPPPPQTLPTTSTIAFARNYPCVAVVRPFRSTSATAGHRRRFASGPGSSPSSSSLTPAPLRTRFPVEELRRPAPAPPRFRQNPTSASPFCTEAAPTELHVGVTHMPGLFPLIFLPLLRVVWLTGVSSAAPRRGEPRPNPHPPS